MNNHMRKIMVEAIRRSWCKDTSSVPDAWSETNAARGQCAVTSLIVQDVLGGKLLRTVIQGESHYFNELDSGERLDLTLSQFDVHAIKGLEFTLEERSREYVLSYPETVARYHLLLRRFNLECEHLAQHFRDIRS